MWEPLMNYSSLREEDNANPLYQDTFSDDEI